MVIMAIAVTVAQWASNRQTGGPPTSYPIPTTTPVPAPTVSTTPGQIPSQDDNFLGNIPSLGAQVKSLRFFESGSSGMSFNSRIYANKFVRLGTRFIIWELLFTIPPPDHRIPLEVEAVWRNSNDEIVERKIRQGYIDSGWASVYQNEGLGSDTPGQAWLIGKYKVELYVMGSLVARSSFEIVDRSATITGAAGASLGAIPSLNIQPISLRLFESGPTVNPQDSRTYTDKFYQNLTRHVCWELKISNPPVNQGITLEIIEVWNRTSGEIVALHTHTGYIASGVSDSVQSDGWGSSVAGQFWIRGDYTIDLYAGGALIGSVPFSVFDDAVQNYPSKDQQHQQPLAQSGPTTHSKILSSSSPSGDYSNNNSGSAEQAVTTNEFVTVYRAEHKHSLGGRCVGILQLTKTHIFFASNQHVLHSFKSEIKHIDRDGVTDNEGRNWHFRIKEKSNEDVNRLLQQWYNSSEIDLARPNTARILRDIGCSTRTYISTNLGPQTTIEFVNVTPEPRQIFAVGLNAEIILYKSLASYEISVQGSAAGSRWLVTDQYGNCKGLFVAFEQGTGAAIIRK